MISDSLHNAKDNKYDLIHFEEIDSTNEEAKRRFLKGEKEPVLLWADYQSAGKGRNGRSFYSPHDTGIYFSYLHVQEGRGEMNNLIFVTTAAAVFVADALNTFAGADAKIKWVNDIYQNEKKVCGILAEAVFDEESTGIVVGIGINLTTEEFPDDIKELASGVGFFGKEKLTEIKENILKHAGSSFAEFFENCDSKEYRKQVLEKYRSLSLVIGKEVSFYKLDTEEKKGIATAIEEDGSLIVTMPDGSRERLASGEIHLRFS